MDPYLTELVFHIRIKIFFDGLTKGSTNMVRGNDSHRVLVQ